MALFISIAAIFLAVTGTSVFLATHAAAAADL